MRHLVLRTLLLPVLALLAGATQAQPVEPGQAFRWQQMEVRAPTSPGWVRIGAQGQALAFMRRSEALARSEVALVSVFTVPDGLDREGFTAWVNRAVEAEYPPERFRPVERQSAPLDDRGYACVLHQGLSLDLQAAGLPKGSDPPVLHMSALYCRHPDRAGAGFSASFSTRGPGVDDSLPERARRFIDGVLPERVAAAPPQP